jgi:IS5 family transposase
VPVCRFARAPRCRSFGDVAAFGHDEVARQTYYGLRAHVRLAWPGVLVDCALAPANIHDTEGAEEVLQGVAGFVLADRNYWKPELSQRLKNYGLFLLAPYRSAKRQKQPWPHFLTHMRYRIETVFGQLVERFHAKRVWARDLWHLTSRWMRKFLCHNIAGQTRLQMQIVVGLVRLRSYIDRFQSPHRPWCHLPSNILWK